MINAKSDSTVFFEHKTQGNYGDNGINIVVLPDEKTILGIEGGTERGTEGQIIIMEDITRKDSIIRFGSHDNFAETIFYNEHLDVFMVGDDGGNVTQYSRESGNWKMKKKYGYLEIGEIKSSAYYKNLAVFGGDDSHLVVIDMEKQIILPGKIKTAIQEIYSICFCPVSDSKTLLTVNGSLPNYSFETDVFSCKQLFKHFNLNQTNVSQSIPSSNELSKQETKCKCNSTKLINIILSNVENYINQVVNKLVTTFKTNKKIKRPKKNKSKLIIYY